MQHFFWRMIASLGLLVWLALSASAESLSGNGTSLCSSEKHYQPGDIVMVIISETAAAQQSASTELHKNAKVGYTTGGVLGGLIPSADGGISTDHTGGGNLSRAGKMQGMVGAVVEEVLPTGGLKIKGEQEIMFDSGRQLITVEGIARPRDISSENEIFSFRLADARIEYYGRDALHEKARTGFLTRFLDWLWIF